MAYTLITDIDGVLIYHDGDHTQQITYNFTQALPGVRQRLNEWSKMGHKIIFMTARRESSRQQTEEQLKELGLFWDILIMGVGNSRRILINDLKPDMTNMATAIAVNLERNVGLEDLDLYRECSKADDSLVSARSARNEHNEPAKNHPA